MANVDISAAQGAAKPGHRMDKSYGQVQTHCAAFVMCVQVSGECATVTDTWAQVTLPIPLSFTPPTDGVSNPAVATGNPPALQARVCAPTNFAYIMSIPASQPSQRACGDWAVRRCTGCGRGSGCECDVSKGALRLAVVPCIYSRRGSSTTVCVTGVSSTELLTETTCIR